MEVEAKFRVDDAQAFEKLMTLTSLAPYSLQPQMQSQHQRNTYYDTASHLLQASHYGLRIRTIEGQQSLVTLKGPNQAKEGLHQRAEWEIEANEPNPSTWPDGDLRSEVERLISNAPLIPLLTIETHRHLITVTRASLDIAEICLDEGVFQGRDRALPFRELEIELLSSGSIDDLNTLIAALKPFVELIPENRSKLEQALVVLEYDRMKQDTPPTHYHGDIAHTRYVVSLSLILFEALQETYHLPDKARDLIELGALLHDVGVSIDEAHHHSVGRDIVLSSDVPGLDEDDRALVACLVAFHRKKVRPETEPAYIRLNKKKRRLALLLASLLRVADGLDYSHSQTTQISSCTVKDDAVFLHISGPAEDGLRAIKKSDLWMKTIGGNVHIINDPESREETFLVPAVDEQRWDHGVIVPTNEKALAEMGRRLMRRYFQKLLVRENEAREDKDSEAVHDMRVATRRLRAILPVLESVVSPKKVRLYRKGMQKIAQSLARVRDSDVFIQHVQGYCEELPDQQQNHIDPLVNALQREREVARTHMLMELDSQHYSKFKRNFSAFITDNAAEWSMDVRICEVAGSRIWKCYEELRLFETRIDMDNLIESNDDVLHTTRIAGKRLRYALELFSDQYEEKVQPVLEPLVALQECLGSIQDISVAKTFVATIDGRGDEKAALDAYVLARTLERSQQIEKFPALWNTMMADSYRRNLMELIISL
jgi:CHAD domain-containing protein/uncharacterized protein YjbK